jgi:hypothetical protein
MRIRIVAIAGALIVFAAWPTVALGQTGDHPSPTPRVQKWDAGGSVGWYQGRIDGGDQSQHWYHRSMFVGGSIGRYWTDHLKTEIDVGWTSNGTLMSWAGPTASSEYCCEFARQNASNTKLSVAQIYQFGRNAWFHTFVGAALDVDRERNRIVHPAQTVVRYQSAGTTTPAGTYLDLPAYETSVTRWRVGPLGLAGFKAYISERAYIRSEVRIGAHEVNMRVGFGVDF